MSNEFLGGGCLVVPAYESPFFRRFRMASTRTILVHVHNSFFTKSGFSDVELAEKLNREIGQDYYYTLIEDEDMTIIVFNPLKDDMLL